MGTGPLGRSLGLVGIPCPHCGVASEKIECTVSSLERAARKGRKALAVWYRCHNAQCRTKQFHEPGTVYLDPVLELQFKQRQSTEYWSEHEGYI